MSSWNELRRSARDAYGQLGVDMVRRLQTSLLGLHQVGDLAPYGALAPIAATKQGEMGAAREVWDRQGKPGGEGNADFERAVLEHINTLEVLNIIDEGVGDQAVGSWRWKDRRDLVSMERYLASRDVLYDADYLGVLGGATINP